MKLYVNKQNSIGNLFTFLEKVELSIKEQAKKANLPGFRKGMVPVAHMKRMYGKSILVEEINTLTKLLNEYIIIGKEAAIAYCPKSKSIIKSSYSDIKKDYPLLSHSCMKLIDLQSKICLSNTLDKDQEYKEEYFLKEYIILTAIEPCVMCSFALLHSRISKIYYIMSNLSHGGLESKIKLSNYESLNHSFDVFKISIN